MILQALVELAHREQLIDDPDFEPKEVRWVISLNTGGRFLGAIMTEGLSDGRGKLRPKVMRIPRTPPRANNPPPAFLVDTAEFVLGFDPKGSRDPQVLVQRNRAFADYIAQGHGIAHHDEGLKTVLAFLGDDEQKAACVAMIRDRLEAPDRIAFYFEPDQTLVHDRDKVRAAWKALRSDVDGPLITCLCCRRDAVPIRLHPQIGNIPGAAKPIPVVSFNKDAFMSYGWDGNENSPICQECAVAYTTAMSRLFHPQYPNPLGVNSPPLPRRSLRLSDDTAVAYWASGDHTFPDEFGGIDFADPAQAEALFESVSSGRGVSLDDATPFHALIVTGGQGRATLRGYHQTTVGVVASNLRSYFADIDIIRRFPRSPRWPPLSWLVRSLAAQGKFENVDPDLSSRLFMAILSGSRFPQTVLHQAVARIRAEPENPDRGQFKHRRERLALIRATLNRQFRDHEDQTSHPRIKSLITREIPVMLDPDCNNNAYCLGRLFAVLEKLQGEAIGRPAATITDRFYGSASATPAAVFATLLRKAQHHLAKLDGPFYSKRIQEILDLLEPGNAFPSTLSLEEQGLFALGYYHQKASLWRGNDKTVDVEPEPDAVAAV